MSLWVDAKVTRTGEVIQVCQRRTANVVGCKGRRSCKGPDSIKYSIKLNAVHVAARGEPVPLWNLSRLFWFPASFPFGVSCCVPHCRFDSWPFYCLGVTSPLVSGLEDPSKTSYITPSSVS